jgi:hypothetical protein
VVRGGRRVNAKSRAEEGGKNGKERGTRREV